MRRDALGLLVTGTARWRRWVALVLGLAFTGTILTAVLRAVAPSPAPPTVTAGPPLGPRLTTRLMLVLVDGLRYDVATDPLLMPNFARAMRERASGEIWAGRVSMTSSAILALGTGQPGRLEQVIRNVDPQPAPFNSWIENAARGQLRVGVVGDNGWSGLYERHLWKSRLDPEGVAIDVDFNAEALRGSRELIALSPDALILHFGTPDHQGHAYGIRSQRYAEHIHQFDADLAALLAALDARWTVVVTSDHGAADSGTHGTDVPIQRRSPIYAYGPGIREGTKLGEPALQLDLAVTLPILLGVSPPAHGLGNPLAFLDTPDLARIACENAARVVSYLARAVGSDDAGLGDARRELAGCAESGSEPRRIAAATRTVRVAETAVAESIGLGSPDIRAWTLGIAALGIVLLRVLLPELPSGGVVVTLLVLAASALLVFQVERLPSVWPNVVRVTFFVVANAVLLLLLLWPAATARWLERRILLLGVLAPVGLVVSYPADCRPESSVLAAALAVLFLGYGRLRRGLGRFFGGYRPNVPLLDVCVFVTALVVLMPTLFREGATYSGLFADDRIRGAVAAVVTAGCLAWLVRGLRAPLALALLVGGVGASAVLFRTSVGPVVGRSVWFGLVAAFVVLLIRRELGWAVIAGALSVIWVSRDFESLPLFGGLAVATVLGRALGADRERGSAVAFPLTNALLLVTLQFALAFVLRIGVQDGLEFGGMYWGAGGFNDSHVPPLLIGVALTFKYAMGALLIGLCLREAWPGESAGLAARAFTSCFVLRALALAGMFMVAGNSYWTALRVFGDLPTALAMSVGSLALVFLEAHMASAGFSVASRSAS